MCPVGIQKGANSYAELGKGADVEEQSECSEPGQG